MRKFAHIWTIGAIVLLTMAGCSTQKNTAGTRWWHSFNARYNIYLTKALKGSDSRHSVFSFTLGYKFAL